MLLIRCPYCEEDRPELELRNAGEAHIARSQTLAQVSDEDFERFFFIRTNPKGVVHERWRHVHGCARFFNAVRDTVTDKFFLTYKAGEPKPEMDFGDKTRVDEGRGDRPGDSGPGAWANVPPAEINVGGVADK